MARAASMRSPVSSSSIACCQLQPLRQPDRADDRRHTDAHLGKAELRVLARDDEVAPRHEREPVAEAVAVHRGDDGLEDLPAALERVDASASPRTCPRTRPPSPAPSRRSAPDAERLARAGDDRDPRVLLVAEAGERVVEIVAHLAVDRVERLGPVVRDRRDMTVELVPNGVTHGVIRNGSGRLAATPVLWRHEHTRREMRDVPCAAPR